MSDFLEIKFSHKYSKLRDQKTAYLIHMNTDVLSRLSPDLIEYDTRYETPDGPKYYEITGYMVLVLYFVGDKGIPFSTIRSATTEKSQFYSKHIGDKFQLTILEGGSKNG